MSIRTLIFISLLLAPTLVFSFGSLAKSVDDPCLEVSEWNNSTDLAVPMRDICYRELAKDRLDEEICREKIKESTIREECFAGIAQAMSDPNICSKVSVKKAKKLWSANIFQKLCAKQATRQIKEKELIKGPDRLTWVNDERIAAIKRFGIDLKRDFTVRKNAPWSFESKSKMKIGQYACPAGTVLDLSRSIVLIRASSESPCTNKKGSKFSTLKLLPNGSAAPLQPE